ncbi:kinase-like domain-containing protein [Xylariaceae sp. FL0016]|nr:kinase-like domain-containing protein [Xylariaceae sp. FL0016]
MSAETMEHEPLAEMDVDASSSSEDSQSRRSTSMYEGCEAFDTYKDKVFQLCRTLWPGYSDEHFNITRMRGGENNRIISIRVSATRPDSSSGTEAPPSDASSRNTNHHIADRDIIPQNSAANLSDEASGQLSPQAPPILELSGSSPPDNDSSLLGIKQDGAVSNNSPQVIKEANNDGADVNEPHSSAGRLSPSHTAFEDTIKQKTPLSDLCAEATHKGLQDPLPDTIITTAVTDILGLGCSPSNQGNDATPTLSINKDEEEQEFLTTSTNMPLSTESPKVDHEHNKEDHVSLDGDTRIPVEVNDGPSPGESEEPSQAVKQLNLPPGEYILRVPRMEDYKNILHEVNMLRFLENKITIDVPTVMHFDASAGDKNPLNSPYILQRRVPGTCLLDSWEDLNHSQRLCICLDMARLCKQLMSITNTSGGTPDLELGKTVNGTYNTRDVRFPGDPRGYFRSLKPQSPMDTLCDRLHRWIKKWPICYGTSPYAGALEIVKYMQATNQTFGTDASLFYLNHGDLHPRNIMIEMPSKSTAFVTGILDWDDAQYAPAVVSFSPPSWLWVSGYWQNEDDEEFLEEEELWEAAAKEPTDEEAAEIKALFDKMMGGQYLRYAYSPDVRLALKIWRATYDTISATWVDDDLLRMHKEWKLSIEKSDNCT